MSRNSLIGAGAAVAVMVSTFALELRSAEAQGASAGREVVSPDLLGDAPGLDVVGRGSRLLPQGTTDVWAHRQYAYLGTGQLPCGDGTGENGSGIRIFDIRNPSTIREVGVIPSPAGSRSNDVKVRRMSSGDILVHSNESCDEGPGGFEVWNVMNPLNPVHLAHVDTDDVNPFVRDEFDLRHTGVHNLFLFGEGSRDYVAVVVESIIGNFQIFEITDPEHPVRVGFWGPEQMLAPNIDWVNEVSFSVLEPAFDYLFTGFGQSAHRILHDVTVSGDGTRAWLSTWDAGLVLLDISDPADPVFVSAALDPSSEDGEVNSHAAWPTADGLIVVETEEDFAPFGLSFRITSGAAAGTHRAREGVLTYPIVELPDRELSGPVTYVGFACNFSVSVPPASSRDAIALVPGGGCDFVEQASNIVAAGYVGIIVFAGPATGDEPLFLFGPDVPVPAIGVGRSTGLAVAGVRSAADLFVGASGESVLIRRVPDGWGGVRVWDYTDPASPVLASTFNTACSANPLDATCDSPGDYSVHNVVVDGRMAYLSWYSEGVLVLDVSDPYAPREVARYHAAGPEFEAQNGGPQDVWGIYKIPGQPLIYASDRNGGLYVLRRKEDDADTPQINPSPPSESEHYDTME